jgi:hypothetical protein
MSTKPRLVLNRFHNLDLQNAKELKYCSSSMLLETCTMEISVNLKYFGKEKERIVDLERVRQRWMHIKVAHFLSFIDFLQSVLYSNTSNWNNYPCVLSCGRRMPHLVDLFFFVINSWNLLCIVFQHKKCRFNGWM